jgi:lysozyme
MIALWSAGYALFGPHKGADHRVLAPRFCPIDQGTAGIDVSYYQGDITWSRVRRAGVKFAFIRAADGVDILDTKFDTNWKGAHMAGIPRGAYQYFRADESPLDQADVMIALLRTHGTGELPPVIDLEDAAGLPLATVAANARIWIDRVRSELKVEPLVYTNPGMWISRGAPELGTQLLWLAHYTEICPTIPAPWVRWKIWQYTDTGRVDGIDGFVDLDVLDGTTARF